MRTVDGEYIAGALNILDKKSYSCTLF